MKRFFEPARHDLGLHTVLARAALVLLTLATGCGVKGPPLPPIQTTPQQIESDAAKAETRSPAPAPTTTTLPEGRGSR